MLRKPLLLSTLLLFLLSTTNHIFGQECANFGIVTTATPSDCFSNGTIAVTVSPEFQGSLNLENAEYSITSATPGGFSRTFEQIADGIIRNVPGGSYFISMRAFCIASGIKVVSSSNLATIDNPYVVPEVYANTSDARKSLNCIPSGFVPIVVKGGKAPYTITMTGFPAEYTGPKTFPMPSEGTLNLDNLNPGDYKFDFTDQCTYHISFTATIGVVANDFPLDVFPFTFVAYTTDDGDCSKLRVQGRNTINPNHPQYPDLNYYWNMYPGTYYEVSYSYIDTPVTGWLPMKDHEYTELSLPPGVSYSDGFKNGGRPQIKLRFRIKGTNDSGCEHVPPHTPYLDPFYFKYYPDLACENYSARFISGIAGEYDVAACYPLEWKFIKGDCETGEILKQGRLDEIPPNVPSRVDVTVDNLQFNTTYKMCFKDAKGTTWSQNYYQIKAEAVLGDSSSYCMPTVGNGVIWMYNMTGAQKIEMINAPAGAPAVPVVTNWGEHFYYPFGKVYLNLPVGEYTFRVTNECGSVKDFSWTNSKYALESFTYDTAPGCNGLKVYPKGKYKYGATSYPAYFRIQSAPPGVNLGNQLIQEGEYLELPESGRYVIQIQKESNPSGCAMDTVVIDYEKSLLSLDPSQTYAYVCEGETVGNVSLVAKGGSGNYLYELLGSGLPANSTGKFKYGTSGQTYTVKISDQQCTNSFEQDVTMADLQTAQITYLNKPNGQYCLGELIGLNCITLGETDYSWTGPDDFTSDEQYPRILNATSAMVGVYTVSVRPEHCGSTLSRSLDVNVTGFTNLSLNDVKICETDPFSLQLSNAEEAVSYKWSKSEANLSNSGNTYPITAAAITDSGVYKVIATNQYNCSGSASAKVRVSPLYTTWTALGNNEDWNDQANWDRGIPGACTYVTVPGNKVYYPILQASSPTYDQAECDTIEFNHGGEVAKTYLLNYNGAKVNMDLQSNRWYCLSAPLRDMFSGDFYHESSVKRQNPSIYMMQYQTTNPETGQIATNGVWSKPFNTLGVPLSLGMGYSAWVDFGEMDNTTVFSLKFPKKDQTYDMYTWGGDVIGSYQMPQRNNPHRFVYETGSPSQASTDGVFSLPVTADLTGSTTAIVGNPYMSHLDFGAFYTANSSKILSSYQIWGGQSFEAVLVASNITISTSTSDLDRYIAPVQSFIVSKISSGTIGSLQFTPDMSVVCPNAGLRASKNEGNVLKMEVLKNGKHQSGIALRVAPGALNTYSPQKDVLTYFNETDFINESENSPVILYSLVDGKEASIRTIGDVSVSLELGIRTMGKGKMTLRLGNTELLNNGIKVYLQDRQTGHQQDLQSMPEYTFDNTTGDVKKRFYLKIAGTSTGLDKVSDAGVDIYSENNTIYVASNGADYLNSIEIYSLEGRKLLSQQDLQTHNANYELLPGQKIVIVKVLTQKNSYTKKIILK